MTYSPRHGSQNGTFCVSNGGSSTIGSSRMRRQWTPSADASAFSVSLPSTASRTMALYRSSGFASGLPSTKGTKSDPGSIQTMLLSVEPSNSKMPRDGFVHVMPSALSA